MRPREKGRGGESHGGEGTISSRVSCHGRLPRRGTMGRGGGTADTVTQDGKGGQLENWPAGAVLLRSLG